MTVPEQPSDGVTVFISHDDVARVVFDNLKGHARSGMKRRWRLRSPLYRRWVKAKP